MKQPSKTNYSVAGVADANSYGLNSLTDGILTRMTIPKDESRQKVIGGIAKLGINNDKGSIADKLNSMDIGNDRKKPIPVSSEPGLTTTHPSSNMSGGKKHKSKRMKSRSLRKYKGKRTNKTRRYRK